MSITDHNGFPSDGLWCALLALGVVAACLTARSNADRLPAPCLKRPNEIHLCVTRTFVQDTGHGDRIAQEELEYLTTERVTTTRLNQGDSSYLVRWQYEPCGQGRVK